MKKLFASVIALGLMAGAANAAGVGIAIGPVGVHVGQYHWHHHWYHHRHWDRDHFRYW
jgi:hypothetical protein